ncbi:MAG: Holliday junction branch migration protein RuvA [Erysipelotrichaceae bacterium]|nr:Holliday junction branch migration protein RuvA [Erysipelotrichaceae bacterium]MDD3923674.1 Holliday junction branch migration protein RuvA [Erysipelotrichaceae bacterium]MDD4642193.1 Holliday junction branch migration protein RuvA [Erysipelotrichaceae bacterium]
MIAFVKGKVFAYGIDHVIIEANGIGYRINFTHADILELNKEMTIYTYQHVREDEISLFGFVSLDEYELFIKLISVKGLGPKTALNMLSVVKVEEMIKIIETEDVSQLKRLPGIGAKTASQIILDLKGKLIDTSKNTDEVINEINETMTALKSLGYKNQELQFLPKELKKHPGLKTEDYIRLGLQILLARKGG